MPSLMTDREALALSPISTPYSHLKSLRSGSEQTRKGLLCLLDRGNPTEGSDHLNRNRRFDHLSFLKQARAKPLHDLLVGEPRERPLLLLKERELFGLRYHELLYGILPHVQDFDKVRDSEPPFANATNAILEMS
jgi:hypothetical protein